MHRKELVHGTTAGPQPSEMELRHLPQEGFATLIDLRPEDVEDIDMSPEKEREIARSVGLRYVHLPIDWDDLDNATVDRFREVLHEAHQPVYVHSVTGKGAAALVVADRAIQKRQNAKEAVRAAEGVGAIHAGSRVEDFLAQYVAARVGEEEV